VEVSINSVTDCDQEINISLSQDELRPHFEEALRKVAPSIELKGFRKGKAPLSMVKKMYGQSIEYDALDNIANESFKKTMEEKNIQPIGTPTLVDLQYKPGQPLSFKIKYEVKPSFELKDYKTVAVEKPVHTVTEDEISEEMKRLQHINATYEEAQRVDGPEYIVTADLQDLDDTGAPLIGKKNDGMRIYLNEATTEPEIKNALSNAEAGGTYRASFEHQHGDHTHKVNLQLTVKKIEKVIHPEIDDNFVKKVSKEKYATVADFKKGMAEDLQHYWDDQAEKTFTDNLTGEIVRLHEFAVPESLVAKFIDSFMEDVKNQQPDKQFPKGFDQKKYRDAFRSSAIWQAKWFLIREQLLQKENIVMTDADIETMAEEESKRLGIDKERLVQFYKSSDTASDRILTDKLIATLKRYATIKEVPDTGEHALVS
jgi:trigger factor